MLPPGERGFRRSRPRPDQGQSRIQLARCETSVAMALRSKSLWQKSRPAQAPAIRSRLARSLGIRRRPADIDAHVAAHAPAQLLQPLHECGEAGLFGLIRSLCSSARRSAASARPAVRAPQAATSRRAAEQRDEFAASDESCHLIPPAGRATASTIAQSYRRAPARRTVSRPAVTLPGPSRQGSSLEEKEVDWYVGVA